MQSITALLWGVPTAAAIAICALYVSVKTRFVQLRRFPEAMGWSVRSMLSHGSGVSSLEAVCTALAGTVGTGNIAGVAVALSMGGPGAIFWMWVSALLGMGLKYAEISLAVKYRERHGGEYAGGPMYYIKNGLGRRYRRLAVLFALFGTAASFGLGNILQLGSVLTLSPSGPIPPMAISAVMAALVFASCRGGAGGRGRISALIVPVMAGVYILACLGVVISGIRRLPGAVGSIFSGALGREAILGGTAGSALSWGLRRGLFSSEAGLGSSPMAHASAEAGDPERQGLMGIFEVFVDTALICTLTALAVLCSGVELPRGVPAGAGLILSCLSTVYGPRLSGAFLSVSMSLFAFSSIVGWSLYGERCVEFLAGPRAAGPYRAAFALATLLAPLMTYSQMIAVSDAATFFMLLTNLTALCLLARRGGGIPVS